MGYASYGRSYERVKRVYQFYIDSKDVSRIDLSTHPDVVKLWPGYTHRMRCLKIFFDRGKVSGEKIGDFEKLLEIYKNQI